MSNAEDDKHSSDHSSSPILEVGAVMIKDAKNMKKKRKKHKKHVSCMSARQSPNLKHVSTVSARRNSGIACSYEARAITNANLEGNALIAKTYFDILHVNDAPLISNTNLDALPMNDVLLTADTNLLIEVSQVKALVLKHVPSFSARSQDWNDMEGGCLGPAGLESADVVPEDIVSDVLQDGIVFDSTNLTFLFLRILF